MPRGRKNQSQLDDEDGPFSQSQSLSQSQSQRSQRRSQAARLSEAELARLAVPVVRCVLATHGRGEPLRRDSLRRAVEPQHASCLQQIIEAADLQLRDVFGMSLEVLPNKRDLVLVNRLPVTEDVRQDEPEAQRRGLLFTILALIFMSNGMVHEETLWRFLAKLGVHKDRPHECFGNVKKLVTEDFKRAGYLRTEEVKQKDRMVLLFHWGDGADLAVDRNSLLEIVCNIWGDNIQPEDWPEQHQLVLQHQRKREEQEAMQREQ